MLSTLYKPVQSNLTTTLPNSLESQVGNTPLLQLQRTAEAFGLSKGVSLTAKAEWFNPSGSVKDRAALNIIRTAEQNGQLRPGMTLLDSTSGNMGIAYATFGAALDIPVTLVMPENASPERKAILRALGAELVLTEPNMPLDSGVEFMVHPPGKKVTRLSLLSGGEKALSAIAFIFSIFYPFFNILIISSTPSPAACALPGEPPDAAASSSIIAAVSGFSNDSCAITWHQ